jgi:hypothetical protein
MLWLDRIGCTLVTLMMEAVHTFETSAYAMRLHGTISQKALIFILATVRT